MERGQEALAAQAQALLERARRYLPALSVAATRLAEYKVCIRQLPADGYSIVGRPTGVEGCYVIVTHSGVTLAAHLAALAANEIMSGQEEPILAPYRLQRFCCQCATRPAADIAGVGDSSSRRTQPCAPRYFFRPPSPTPLVALQDTSQDA